MPSNRTRLILKTAAATLVLSALAGALAGFAVYKGGWYNIGSTQQHWQIVHTFLEQGMHYSVRHHARDVTPPALGSPAQLRLGAAVYRDNCVQCHGAPGVAMHDLGKSMQPVPGPLIDAARRWKARELYWITRHGIKMSGMPAWEYHLPDEQLWAVVAFLQVLPALTSQAYAQAAAVDTAPPTAAASPAPRRANLERGRVALAQYACHGCHMIPGVTGSEVFVGRPLAGLADRKFIAGTLPNTQANLVRWIRDPQSVDPLTAMPAMGVSEADARDMSAYLLSRR